jgi:hypothetical protein
VDEAAVEEFLADERINYWKCHADWGIYHNLVANLRRIGIQANFGCAPEPLSFPISSFLPRFSNFSKFTQMVSQVLKNRMRSPIFDIGWKIDDPFCGRIIVLEGFLQSIPTLGHSHSSSIQIWIPSTTEFIPPKWIREDKSIQSMTFESGQTLLGIKNEGISSNLSSIYHNSSID